MTKGFLFRLLLLLVFVFPTTVFAADDYSLVDRIVAIVDDDVIVASELKKTIAETRSKLESIGKGNAPESQIQDMALEKLVLSKLQLKAAEKIGISVDEEAISKAIGIIAQRNNMSLTDMQEALTADGVNFSSFRNTIKQQIILSQLRSKAVLNRIKVSKGEVDNFLANEGSQLQTRQAYLLRHILIAKPENASESELTALQKKTARVENLLKTEEFSSVAQQYSDGSQAIEGGDLGWRKADEVPSLFIKPATEMQRGEIRGPIEAGNGMHFIQLADFKGGERHIISQTHARHILVRPGERLSDAEAKNRLEQLRERILNGDDFANLARSNSDDKGSAIRGGDLRWLSPGDTVSAFEKIMDSLAKDEISEPFQSPFGWHIVQVLDRRDQDETDKAIRSKAKKILLERKGDDAMQNYLQRLRDEAYVDIRLRNDFE